MRLSRSPATAKTLARLALGAWVSFSALNAQAADLKDVKAAFGNTVLATYPDGRAQRIWFHENGSYDAVGRRGGASSGKWSLKADKVCLKQKAPFKSPLTYCTPFPADGHVGSVWDGKDLAGTPIQMKLVKGIQKPKAKAAD